jgi:hypothetical protein
VEHTVLDRTVERGLEHVHWNRQYGYTSTLKHTDPGLETGPGSDAGRQRRGQRQGL